MQARILIIEDESSVRDMLRFALEDENYLLIEAGSAEQGYELICREPPDLILLDWMLPGISGLDLAQKLRRELDCRMIPIIMLTAKAEENDLVHGLEGGVDDYMVKPFSVRELKARIRAVLRRSQRQDDDNLCIDKLVLDVESHKVSIEGHEVMLGPTEFRLLRFLLTNQERVFSREQILDRVWGQNVYVEDRTVDVHIRRLRKSLMPYGYDRYIQTVRTIGYRLSIQVSG